MQTRVGVYWDGTLLLVQDTSDMKVLVDDAVVRARHLMARRGSLMVKLICLCSRVPIYFEAFKIGDCVITRHLHLGQMPVNGALPKTQNPILGDGLYPD